MDGGRGRSPQPKPARRRPRARQENPGDVPEAEDGPVPPALAHWIKLTSKDLKIRLKDRSWAAEVVNDFWENLLKFLRAEQPLFQAADFLTTGSYFEKVKIHSPDEFDMMLKVQLPSSVHVTKLDGGLYYRLDLVRPTRGPVQAFLLETRLTISSSKLLSEMHGLVRKFLRTYRAPDRQCFWEVNRKRPSSPAVTLSLRSVGNSHELISVDVVFALEVQGWPPAVRNGPDVENWLGKKVRQEIRSLPCYFVPKRMKGQRVHEDARESWRISFSHVEKKIMMFHGNKKTCCESKATKCCRKPCLMLLKSLIEGLKRCFPKELEDLCSYHGKTVFLHALSSRFDDSSWALQKLPACFLYLVAALENHAHSGILPHFFVPESNLFSSAFVPRKSLAFLVRVLEEQRREGLPLLKPPAPASPLRPTVAAAETTTGSPTENPLTPLDSVKLMLVLLVVCLGLMCFVCFKR